MIVDTDKGVKCTRDYNLEAKIELQNSFFEKENNPKWMSETYVIKGEKYIHFKYQNNLKCLKIKDLNLSKNIKIKIVSDLVGAGKRLYLIIYVKEGQTNILYRLQLNTNLNYPKLKQEHPSCLPKEQIKKIGLNSNKTGFMLYSENGSKSYKIEYP